ncbi:MAG TPA: hypothetical protein VMF89_21285, partial [Polyangiales bacterium]|nr:hypothetical protein [Polyangiales bacterium]
LSSDAARYRFIASEVDSGTLYSITTSNVSRFADFLRPNAPVHLVMVTDDNDDVAGAQFQANMERALGRPFTLHAIASENNGGFPCANPICGGIPIPTICGAAAPGDNYYSVARATKGETLSICASDWTMLFSRLQSAVIASVPLPCDYSIPAPTGGGPLDYGKVQVVYTDSNGADRQLPRAQGSAQCGGSVAWHYDDPSKPTKLVLCPAACQSVQAGGSMDIAFGCAPELL